MRLNRGLLTSSIVFLTVLVIVLNSKSAIEFTGNSGSYVEEHHFTKEEISNDQAYRYVTPSLAELGARGNLPKTNKHILMVTRIPDSGAEMLVLILQRLQGYNAFKHIRLPPENYGLLSNLQEELLVEEVTSIIRQEAIPLTFDGDVRFFNFSKFGRQAPTFISIVRNPINLQNLQRYRKNPETVLENRAIPHFCGQHPRCAEKNDKWALQRAKANIIDWYPVVGILDCMKPTLKVLENKFPSFFKGAIQSYRNIRPTEPYLSDPLSTLKSREKEVLAKLLSDETEFFEWLKFRLLNETSETC